MKKGWDYRDVSLVLQKFREFLMGRKHHLPNLHGRFLPRLSPRSIPQPSIPRGPESINKYSDQWYFQRNARDSVKPPIVAPVGEGPAYPLDCKNAPQLTNMKPGDHKFKCAPTPGLPWWWDGHCYYVRVPDKPKPQPKLDACGRPIS